MIQGRCTGWLGRTRTKDKRFYVCNRLWLSSVLQHIDNLLVSNQLGPASFGVFLAYPPFSGVFWPLV